MDEIKIMWSVSGASITAKCIHCDKDLADKQENITTYFSNNIGYNFCDSCCMNMLLIETPTHIPYPQKLQYKLLKFTERGG